MERWPAARVTEGPGEPPAVAASAPKPPLIPSLSRDTGPSHADEGQHPSCSLHPSPGQPGLVSIWMQAFASMTTFSLGPMPACCHGTPDLIRSLGPFVVRPLSYTAQSCHHGAARWDAPSGPGGVTRREMCRVGRWQALLKRRDYFLESRDFRQLCQMGIRLVPAIGHRSGLRRAGIWFCRPCGCSLRSSNRGRHRTGRRGRRG